MIVEYDYRVIALLLLVTFVAALIAFSLSAKDYRRAPRSAALWGIAGVGAVSFGVWLMRYTGFLVVSLGATLLLVSLILVGIWACVAILKRVGGHPLSLSNTFKHANYELSRMAMLDTLTQLPNRRSFQQHLDFGIRRSARMGNSIALAFIDLDGFKPINDALGHHIGDEVLQAVAKRLNTAVRGCDVVARIGGDEFVALLEDIKSDQDIIPIVERMIQSLRDVFFIDHHEISISASIGIAVYPRDGDIERLMVCADAAMYRAKTDGKNQFRFFDSDIELASDLLMELQRDLSQALARDEFRLHFQPKVDSKTHALTGAEVLLRWQHPIKGMLSPAAFIPAAERFGLINQIGEWVIEESCRTLHRLRNQGLGLNLSINLSPLQCRNPNLVSHVVRVMERFDLPRASLMFEVTELAASSNPEQMDSLLIACRHAGIAVSMDDFGAGNSSLVCLQNLKIDELKLDDVLVKHIAINDRSRAIASSIIALAHALELTVVAEGVETEEQRQTLAKLGCDEQQGFLFSRPVPEEKLAGLIKQLSTTAPTGNVGPLATE
jgi:diguanylate cyclase (GGDEF)-like protein